MSNGLSKPKPKPAPAKLPDPERRKLLCVDCKHHKIIVSWNILVPDKHACGREELFDQVDGEKLYRVCSHSRRADDLCGPHARWFEPKEKS